MSGTPAKTRTNGQLHFAMEILARLPQINNSPFVFTMNGTQPFTNLDNLKRHRVDRLTGEDIPHWQVRDLRRTATTLMAELGVAHHVADKVLNHTSGEISGVAAVSNRFQYLDERTADGREYGRWRRVLRQHPLAVEVRFASDSPLEGDGFELSVPGRAIRPFGRGEDVFQ
jgi:integrase